METWLRSHLFVSYSRKDKRWLDQLLTMLDPAVRNRSVAIWADTHIQPGSTWRDEIAKGLAAANAALLLVSPHYLASTFILEHELTPLLKAAQEEGVRILWVAISHCLHEESPIQSFQCINDPEKPLDSLRGSGPRNRALLDIVRHVIRAVANAEPRTPGPPVGPATDAAVSPYVPVTIFRLIRRPSDRWPTGEVECMNAPARRFFGQSPANLDTRVDASILRLFMNPADFDAFVADQHRLYLDLLERLPIEATVPIRFNTTHPAEEFRGRAFLPVISEMMRETVDDAEIEHITVRYIEAEQASRSRLTREHNADRPPRQQSAQPSRDS